MKTLHYLVMTLATIILSLSTLNAQQNIATQMRCKGQSFTSVKASNGVDVKLLKDTAYRVVVSAPSNNIAKVLTTVKDGVLTIEIKNCMNCHDIDVTVYYKGNITALHTSSGAEIKVAKLNCKSNLTLLASSGSEIEIKALNCKGKVTVTAESGSDIEVKQLETPTLEANASAGSEVELEGHATKATLNASSAAKIDIEHLTTDNITTNTSSAGRIERH